MGKGNESDIEAVKCLVKREEHLKVISSTCWIARALVLPSPALPLHLSVFLSHQPQHHRATTTTQQHRQCSTVPNRRRVPAMPPSQPNAVAAATAAGLVLCLSSRRLLRFGRDKLPTSRLILTIGDHCLHCNSHQTPVSVDDHHRQVLLGHRRPSYGCSCSSMAALFLTIFGSSVSPLPYVAATAGVHRRLPAAVANISPPADTHAATSFSLDCETIKWEGKTKKPWKSLKWFFITI